MSGADTSVAGVVAFTVPENGPLPRSFVANTRTLYVAEGVCTTNTHEQGNGMKVALLTSMLQPSDARTILSDVVARRVVLRIWVTHQTPKSCRKGKASVGIREGSTIPVVSLQRIVRNRTWDWGQSIAHYMIISGSNLTSP